MAGEVITPIISLMAAGVRQQNGNNPVRRISRRSLLPLAGLIVLPVEADAQMSQRARQVRERRACELEQPDCRPEIRVQLEAERRRIRIGLSALAAGSVILGFVLWRRLRAIKQAQRDDLDRLHSHLDEIGGDSERDQAKLDSS